MKVFRIWLTWDETFNSGLTSTRIEGEYIVPGPTLLIACEWILEQCRTHWSDQYRNVEIITVDLIKGRFAAPEAGRYEPRP